MPLLVVLQTQTPVLPIDMASWMQVANANFFGVLNQAGPYLMLLMGSIVAVKAVPKLIHWLFGGN